MSALTWYLALKMCYNTPMPMFIFTCIWVWYRIETRLGHCRASWGFNTEWSRKLLRHFEAWSHTCGHSKRRDLITDLPFKFPRSQSEWGMCQGMVLPLGGALPQRLGRWYVPKWPPHKCQGPRVPSRMIVIHVICQTGVQTWDMVSTSTSNFSASKQAYHPEISSLLLNLLNLYGKQA